MQSIVLYKEGCSATQSSRALLRRHLGWHYACLQPLAAPSSQAKTASWVSDGCNQKWLARYVAMLASTDLPSILHNKQYKYSIVAPQDQFLWKSWCVRKMTFLRKNGTEELLLAVWLCLALQTTEQRHLQTLIDKSVTAVTETEFSLSFVLSTLLSMLVYLKSYFVMTCKQVSKLWLLIHWGVKMWSRQCVFITQDSVFRILRATQHLSCCSTCTKDAIS